MFVTTRQYPAQASARVPTWQSQLPPLHLQEPEESHESVCTRLEWSVRVWCGVVWWEGGG